MKKATRIQALANQFGADTSERADWDEPLLKLAVEVYHEFTRINGQSGYSRYGQDVLSPEEIVQKVYETWSSTEHVSVEWFAALRNPGGMLRTFCQYAAQNLVNQTASGSRQGVFIQPTGFTGSGLDDPTDAPGHRAAMAGADVGVDAFGWLANSLKYSVPSAEDDYMDTVDDEPTKFMAAVEAALQDILAGIKSNTQREIASLYYLDGLEIAEASDELGISLEAGKKSLQRARTSLSEEAIASLVTWRRVFFPESGRQPRTIAEPETILGLAGAHRKERN